jgi:Golgi nucleoside diphosphatase
MRGGEQYGSTPQDKMVAKAYSHSSAAQGNNRAYMAAGGVALMILLVRMNMPASMEPQRAGMSQGPVYGCMLDAGSTGSRIHVYKFGRSADGSKYLLDEVFEQIKPGVSSYAADHAAAGASLAPLLKKAQEVVPEDQWATTPIALYATAGLRLLPNPTDVEGILESLRSALAATPFKFTDPETNVRILDGKFEGIYACESLRPALSAVPGLCACGEALVAGGRIW